MPPPWDAVRSKTTHFLAHGSMGRESKEVVYCILNAPTHEFHSHLLTGTSYTTPSPAGAKKHNLLSVQKEKCNMVGTGSLYHLQSPLSLCPDTWRRDKCILRTEQKFSELGWLCLVSLREGKSSKKSSGSGKKAPSKPQPQERSLKQEKNQHTTLLRNPSEWIKTRIVNNITCHRGNK